MKKIYKVVESGRKWEGGKGGSEWSAWSHQSFQRNSFLNWSYWEKMYKQRIFVVYKEKWIIECVNVNNKLDCVKERMSWITA